eukprot:Hpha_TRINITY_DN16333_c1_g1::TRINITY_DN16333_c1_g1_i3::g.62038::m.62038
MELKVEASAEAARQEEMKQEALAAVAREAELKAQWEEAATEARQRAARAVTKQDELDAELGVALARARRAEEGKHEVLAELEAQKATGTAEERARLAEAAERLEEEKLKLRETSAEQKMEEQKVRAAFMENADQAQREMEQYIEEVIDTGKRLNREKEQLREQHQEEMEDVKNQLAEKEVAATVRAREWELLRKQYERMAEDAAADASTLREQLSVVQNRNEAQQQKQLYSLINEDDDDADISDAEDSERRKLRQRRTALAEGEEELRRRRVELQAVLEQLAKEAAEGSLYPLFNQDDGTGTLMSLDRSVGVSGSRSGVQEGTSTVKDSSGDHGSYRYAWEESVAEIGDYEKQVNKLEEVVAASRLEFSELLISEARAHADTEELRCELAMGEAERQELVRQHVMAVEAQQENMQRNEAVASRQIANLQSALRTARQSTREAERTSEEAVKSWLDEATMALAPSGEAGLLLAHRSLQEEALAALDWTPPVGDRKVSTGLVKLRPPMPSGELLSLLRGFAELMQERAADGAELHSLLERAQRQQSECDAIRRSRTQEHLTALEWRAEEAEKRSEALQKELTARMEELAAAQSRPVDKGDVKETDLRASQEEVRILKAELRTMEREREEEVAELLRQKAAAERQAALAEASAAAARVETVKEWSPSGEGGNELEAELREAVQKREELESTVRQMQHEKQRLQSKIEESERRVEEQRQRRDDAVAHESERRQVAERARQQAQAEKAAVEVERSTLRQSLEDLRLEFDCVSLERETATRLAADRQQKLEDAEPKLASGRRAAQELEALRAELEPLQQRLRAEGDRSAAQELAAATAGLQMEEARREAATAQEHAESARQEVKRGQAERDRERLRAEAAEQQLKRLEATLQEVRKGRTAAEQRLIAEAELRRQELQELRTRNAELEQVTEAGTDCRAELQGEVERLLLENSRLRVAREKAEAAQQAEHVQLVQNLERTRQQLQAVSSERTQAMQNVTQLRTEMDQVQGQHEGAALAERRLREHTAQHSAERQRLAAEIGSLQQQLAAEREIRGSAEHHRHTLEAGRTEAQSEVGHLRAELQRLRAASHEGESQVRVELVAARQRCTELQDALASADAEIDEWRARAAQVAVRTPQRGDGELPPALVQLLEDEAERIKTSARKVDESLGELHQARERTVTGLRAVRSNAQDAAAHWTGDGEDQEWVELSAYLAGLADESLLVEPLADAARRSADRATRKVLEAMEYNEKLGDHMRAAWSGGGARDPLSDPIIRTLVADHRARWCSAVDMLADEIGDEASVLTHVAECCGEWMATPLSNSAQVTSTAGRIAAEAGGSSLLGISRAECAKRTAVPSSDGEWPRSAAALAEQLLAQEKRSASELRRRLQQKDSEVRMLHKELKAKDAAAAARGTKLFVAESDGSEATGSTEVFADEFERDFAALHFSTVHADPEEGDLSTDCTE